MAALLFASRKRCASTLDEPAPTPPHLAKRGRFSPTPAAFATQQQASASAATAEAAGLRAAFATQQQASAEAAALREENGALRARVEELDRDNGVLNVLKRGVAEQHRRQEALERDVGVLKHGVAALHRREAEAKAREEEARREAAELRKKVAELEAANYALAARMLATDSCRFQAFHGPDVF